MAEVAGSNKQMHQQTLKYLLMLFSGATKLNSPTCKYAKTATMQVCEILTHRHHQVVYRLQNADLTELKVFQEATNCFVWFQMRLITTADITMVCCDGKI